ncbi:hypothetical protein E2320_019864, partial [Naja naja]
MTKHIVACQKCPKDIKKYFMELNDEEQNESANSFLFVLIPQHFFCWFWIITNKKVLQTTASQKYTILSFIDKMTPENQEKIDHALARAIYVSGSALSILKMHTGRKLKLLLSSCHLSSRHSLPSLLESEYECVMESVQGKISEALCLAVLTDGQMFREKESSTLSIETGENRQTASISVRKLRVVKLFALLTDNASTMKAAWEIIMD